MKSTHLLSSVSSMIMPFGVRIKKFKRYKRTLFFLAALFFLYYAFVRRKEKRKIQRQISTLATRKTHRIVFGGCGALSIYMMGFIKALLEHFGTEIFRKYCTFEGLSGGAVVAGYSVAAIHGCHDVDFWFQRGGKIPLVAAEGNKFGMLLTTSSVIYALAYQYHTECTEWNGDTFPAWLENNDFSIWMSCLSLRHRPFLYNVAYSKHYTATQFSKYITATTFIPFVLGTWFYYNVAGDKCMDAGYASFFAGGLNTIFATQNEQQEKCRVLYVNFDDLFKIGYGQGKKRKSMPNGNIVHYMNLNELDSSVKAYEFSIYGGEHRADALYERGYKTTQKKMAAVARKLHEFCPAFSELNL